MLPVMLPYRSKGRHKRPEEGWTGCGPFLYWKGGCVVAWQRSGSHPEHSVPGEEGLPSLF